MTRARHISILLASTLGAVALAQPTPPRPESSQPDAAPVSPLPSLDELLGLVEPGSLPPGEPATDLERALSGEQAARDPFEAAVDLIQRSRTRLDTVADAGVATQRLQADALARLDQVIEQARARQQQSQQSSSSSSSSSSQQPQPDQQRQAQAQQQPGQRDNRGEVMAPGLEGVNTGPNIDSAGAAWGALPERLRGALLQGVSDQYSALYERLTERYYQRLAEEADQ
ncbi:MAG: hypothetical protein ACF8Q5_12230 [Phycisphaerales bacterium JB040]